MGLKEWGGEWESGRGGERGGGRIIRIGGCKVCVCEVCALVCVCVCDKTFFFEDPSHYTLEIVEVWVLDEGLIGLGSTFKKDNTL